MCVVCVAFARYGHPLRFYITPHFAKCRAVVALKLHLVPHTASRPFGFTKQALCKVAFAGVGRTAVGASRSLARPTRRRLRALVGVPAPGHWSGAARCVAGQWPAASHVVCAPAHPCASPLRGISPARWPARPPPVGAPSVSAPSGWLATSLVACHARNTGATGLAACKPAWPLAYFSRAIVFALAIYLIAACARSTGAGGQFFINCRRGRPDWPLGWSLTLSVLRNRFFRQLWRDISSCPTRPQVFELDQHGQCAFKLAVQVGFVAG